MRYFDSGLLLKLYVSEPRGKEAEQLYRACPTPPHPSLAAAIGLQVIP